MNSLPPRIHATPPLPEVLLVSCYELGHEPLGLVVPAGVLTRAGLPPTLLDLAVEPFDEKKFVSAQFVGISVPMHTALRLGVRVAEGVRRANPTAHICFYGLYAALNEETLLGLADTCLGPEDEANLLALVRAIVEGTGAPRAVRPLPASANAHRSSTRSLDLTPVRDALPASPCYVRLDDGDRLRSVGYVATTRGCKHTCRHCPLPVVYRGRFHALPADDVVRDAAALVERGVSHITFADPDFLNGPEHARRVARRLHAAFPSLTFDYTAKVEHLVRQPALVEELRDLGNIFVLTAVESLDDHVLAVLEKGHTRADVLAIVRRFREIGLTLRPTLLPFTPWETLEGYENLLNTVAEEGLVANTDPVQYSVRLLVPPGSLLLASPAMAPYLEDLDAEAFTWRWRHPDPRMDGLQTEVVAIVEQAAGKGVDTAETFEAIRAAAETARHGAPSSRGRAVDQVPPQTRPPRLTEDWFC